ncbi:hypothetical protein B0H66DRAFT_538297 [Apodospora peruviana]|uniref:Uncharacterized protein n=1 Tax=Apodospora peruviana TaxID=516989 RepID=A0AAE0HV90_9PEZI|nr:hypothetical protein B0H66DRAFT_538297 [Apodospora peruviana]
MHERLRSGPPPTVVPLLCCTWFSRIFPGSLGGQDAPQHDGHKCQVSTQARVLGDILRKRKSPPNRKMEEALGHTRAHLGTYTCDYKPPRSIIQREGTYYHFPNLDRAWWHHGYDPLTGLLGNLINPSTTLCLIRTCKSELSIMISNLHIAFRTAVLAFTVIDCNLD